MIKQKKQNKIMEVKNACVIIFKPGLCSEKQKCRAEFFAAILIKTKMLPSDFCRYAHKNGLSSAKNREPAPMRTETMRTRKE